MRSLRQTRQLQAARRRERQGPRRLPHERDESTDSQGGSQREVIEQALEDIESGKQETDLYGSAAPRDTQH